MGYRLEATNGVPEMLLSNRVMVEMNMLGTLWSQPELFDDFGELRPYDFVIEESFEFYKLGKKLHDLGYKKLDRMSYGTQMANDEGNRIYFESIGGYNTISKAMAMIDSDNSLRYYDELVKGNALIDLNKSGFLIDKNMYEDELKNMTASQVYDKIDELSDKVFKKMRTGTAKPIDLTQGNHEYIAKADSGINMGVPLDCYTLTKTLAGLHHGNLMIHAGHSGAGKTSSAIAMFVLPLMKAGYKVVLLANEQSVDEFRNTILPTVVSMQLGRKEFKDDYQAVNTDTGEMTNLKWVQRQTLLKGGFTGDQRSSLDAAADWLMNYKGNLIFHPLESMRMGNVKQAIKKYYKDCVDEGRIDENGNVKLAIVYDTFKPSSETGGDQQAWALMSEDAKALHNLIKDPSVGGLGIIAIATMQLSGGTVNQRYLNVNCLAKSKAVKEVVGQMTMTRKLWVDEFSPDQKRYCNPYHYVKDGSGGYVREEIPLDPSKEYHVLFVDKNRYGQDDIQLLYQTDLGTNRWICVGHCTIQHDY